MTHHPIRRILPDGTKVYHDWRYYKPVPLEERKYKVRKPADPRAVRWKGDWFLPLEVLADEDRVMPETIGDEEGYYHSLYCDCRVCRRPAVSKVKWAMHKRTRNGMVRSEARGPRAISNARKAAFRS